MQTNNQRTQREQENALLKQHGYRWIKPDGVWQLLDPTGKPTTTAIALQEIATGNVPAPQRVVCLDDRPSACRWAQAVAKAGCVAVLDTETTDTGKDGEIIDIAIVDQRGKVLFNTLIKPTMPIDEQSQAAQVHGLTNADLEHAPSFVEIWHQLLPLLVSRELVVYNSRFDLTMLRQDAKRHGLDMPDITAHCLMRQYALYHGELVPGNESQYTNKKLSEACATFGIVPGTHRALADAQAAMQVFLAMADPKAYYRF